MPQKAQEIAAQTNTKQILRHESEYAPNTDGNDRTVSARDKPITYGAATNSCDTYEER